MHRSTDNGKTWEGVNNGFINSYVTAMVTTNSNFYAGTYGSGVFLSTDNGTNWESINSDLPGKFIRDFVLKGAVVCSSQEPLTSCVAENGHSAAHGVSGSGGTF